MWYKYEAFYNNKFLFFYSGLGVSLFIKYALIKIKNKNKFIEYISEIF